MAHTCFRSSGIVIIMAIPALGIMFGSPGVVGLVLAGLLVSVVHSLMRSQHLCTGKLREQYNASQVGDGQPQLLP